MTASTLYAYGEMVGYAAREQKKEAVGKTAASSGPLLALVESDAIHAAYSIEHGVEYDARNLPDDVDRLERYGERFGSASTQGMADILRLILKEGAE
jgi:hypothetical protein